MAKGFVGNTKYTAYLGGVKLKAGYLGAQLVYSSGCMVTYVYGGKAVAQVEYNEGDIISNFKAISLESGYALVGWTDSPTNSSGNWVPKTIKASGEAVTLYAITRKTISGVCSAYDQSINLYGLSTGATLTINGRCWVSDEGYDHLRFLLRNPYPNEWGVYFGNEVRENWSYINVTLTAKGGHIEAKASGSDMSSISVTVTSYNYTVG